MIDQNEHWIKELRQEKEISQKLLYEGICTQSFAAKIEQGERELDQLLVYVLLGRLGISYQKYTMVLKKEDILLMKQREELELDIEEERWEEAKKKLQEYRESDFNGVTECLHKQYADFMEATMAYRRMELEKAIEKLKIGIGRTNPRLWKVVDDNKEEDKILLSMIELKQLCMLGEIWEQQQESKEKAGNLWNWIREYLLQNVEDMEYRMKFYPVILYHIAIYCQEKKQWLQCLSYCEEGIEFLKKYKSLLCLKELLELHGQVVKEIGIPEKEENVGYLSMLSFIEENLLDHNRIVRRPHLGSYFIGDVIRNTREYEGKTQEALNEIQDNGKGIADPSTLSKIENGHRRPRRSTCEYYFKQLGLGEYRMGISPVIGNTFQVQQLRWNIDHMLSELKFDNAEEYLKQLERQLDQDNVINKQYIKRVYVILQYYRKEITAEQYREKLIEVLRMTWKDFEIDNIKDLKRFLRRTEINIVINIAQTYIQQKDYKNGIRICDRLKQYFIKFYTMAGYSNYSLLYSTLEQALGLSGKYNESIAIIKEGISVRYYYKDSNQIQKHLYNLGWNYGKKMLESKNKKEYEEYKKACQIYLEQALKGAIFLEDERIISLIEDKRQQWLVD